MARPSFVLSLSEAASLSEHDGELVVKTAARRFVFRRLAPGLLAGLRELAGAGEDERRLEELVLQAGGAGALATLSYCLGRLDRGGLLVRSDGKLMSLVPASPSFRFAATGLEADHRYLLCRFTHVRRDGRRLALESPLSGARILLHGPRATAALAALIEAGRPAELRQRAPDLSACGLALLRGAGMLSDADGDEPAATDWAFPDLLLHASSRMGRHDRPVGGVYPFPGELPPPAIKRTRAHAWVQLERADLDRLRHEDVPVSCALAAPRAVRRYGGRPIDVRELGWFLHRTARVLSRRQVEVGTPDGTVTVDIAPRPYPSGGSLYELEIYAAIRRCSGLDAGLYHYDAVGHRLAAIAAPTAAVERMLDDAAARAGTGRGEVQVLFVLAARFRRRAWKYASTAYSNTLKNVGVLYETMYAVATSMGLGPCAVTDTDASLFDCAAGTDPYEEGAVGALLLGSHV